MLWQILGFITGVTVLGMGCCVTFFLFRTGLPPSDPPPIHPNSGSDYVGPV